MTNDPFTPPPLKALRGCDVYGPGSKTGLSRSEIYRQIAEGTFPPGFAVARNARAWFEHEVDKWLVERATKNLAPAMPEKLARGQKAAADRKKAEA
jgi:prophage regulatory protein